MPSQKFARAPLWCALSLALGLAVSSPHADAAGLGRLHLNDVAVPQSALLGSDGTDSLDTAAADLRAEQYADAVRLARLGWASLAMGTGQAVLDYVIPYVN